MSENARTPASNPLSKFLRRSDLGLALGVVAILVVLILPMPSWMLDFCLAFSIMFSVVVMMTALMIQKPLEFSSFPTVLLIAALLRLSLNLASTRLILANGHNGTEAAGQVIAAFGDFVMGGSFIIGVIVFAILIIVNFIVITKGSGRIAEVAARFSLDAMPGKQMAIDADLSAGLIDEQQAKQRRSELEQESTFYGSMDGASKFVRGDAIAGLLITFINIIGGIIIGVTEHDLTAGTAAENYTVLTVGDGLVSQIPALIISVAAGLLVSKAGVQGPADKALVGQLGKYPAAMGMTSAMLGVLALLPGIPLVPFMLLACMTGAIAYFVPKKREQEKIRKVEEAQRMEREAPEAASEPEEPIASHLAMDHIRLELGYQLLAMMKGETQGRLTDQIKALRKQLAQDMGFVLPAVRIQDNLQLGAEEYVIRIKEIEGGRGTIRPNRLLCMDPTGNTIGLEGEDTKEPTFGLPAKWIGPDTREEAMFRGYTVVDPATVMTTHITEVVRENMPELLSYAETQKLLDELSPENQKLVADVIPNQVTLGGLQRVLQNLLAERISIRDLPTILEGVAEASGATRNIQIITEHVRARLARQISDSHTNRQSGFLPLATLTPEWEQCFAEAIVGEGENVQLSMAPSDLQRFIMAVRQCYEAQQQQGQEPVLLTSPGIRPYVRSIVERFRPQTVVMSQNEIHPKARIQTLAQI
ncbi:MAG: flagellar biosynthesis protein FlhA [Alphaproteobacteria bacterium]